MTLKWKSILWIAVSLIVTNTLYFFGDTIFVKAFDVLDWLTQIPQKHYLTFTCSNVIGGAVAYALWECFGKSKDKGK